MESFEVMLKRQQALVRRLAAQIDRETLVLNDMLALENIVQRERTVKTNQHDLFVPPSAPKK